MATQGTANRLSRVKIFGARPSIANPYNIRDPPRKFELPDDQAEVRTAALMIEGTILIPARLAAITNGDVDAVPL